MDSNYQWCEWLADAGMLARPMRWVVRRRIPRLTTRAATMNRIAQFDQIDAVGKAEQSILGLRARFRRSPRLAHAFRHQPAILRGYDFPKASVAGPKLATKEQELVAAASRGDEQGFAALVEPSMGMLFSVSGDSQN